MHSHGAEYDRRGQVRPLPDCVQNNRAHSPHPKWGLGLLFEGHFCRTAGSIFVRWGSGPCKKNKKTHYPPYCASGETKSHQRSSKARSKPRLHDCADPSKRWWGGPQKNKGMEDNSAQWTQSSSQNRHGQHWCACNRITSIWFLEVCLESDSGCPGWGWGLRPCKAEWGAKTSFRACQSCNKDRLALGESHSSAYNVLSWTAMPPCYVSNHPALLKGWYFPWGSGSTSSCQPSP